ncbi:hypothetical protein D3C86_1574690 [compost metagenome]
MCPDDVGIGTADPHCFTVFGFQLGHNIFIDITGIDHSHYSKRFPICNPAPLNHFLLYAHLFSHPGGEFAATMYEYFFSGQLGKLLQK